jgi:LacI family repressor for deo operon, udp, cdd, tsx, nupC, and nupG
MSSTKRPLRRNSVTMRDVAELAGVSQSTVSRVIRGVSEPIAISEETCQRVMAAVEQLEYHPNVHAGSLRGQKTQMVAMMIADIRNPFYHPIVRAVQDIAYAHGYDVMIANSDHTLEGEQHFIQSVMRRPVDGIIVIPWHLGDDDLGELIDRTGAMVAAVGQHINHPLVDIAFGNDGQAVYDVVTWLHKTKAHSRIGFIGVTRPSPAGDRRRKGYEQALHNMELDVPAGYEQFGDWSLESGYRAMRQLLDLPTLPTAVAVGNDLMAIGAMEAVKQEGLRIPDDMAIVGFDDVPAASWVHPSLTTVAQYPKEMGVHLATALFERINGEYSGPSRRFEIPCRFIERESA